MTYDEYRKKRYNLDSSNDTGGRYSQWKKEKQEAEEKAIKISNTVKSLFTTPRSTDEFEDISETPKKTNIQSEPRSIYDQNVPLKSLAESKADQEQLASKKLNPEIKSVEQFDKEYKEQKAKYNEEHAEDIKEAVKDLKTTKTADYIADLDRFQNDLIKSGHPRACGHVPVS